MNTTIKTTLIILAVLVLASGIFFAGWMFERFSNNGFGWMMGGTYPNETGYTPGGMMGGYGAGGMMGGSGYGGMMGGYGNANADPLTIDQMRSAAEAYIQDSGLPALEVGEIMIFDNNAYAIIMEKDTGIGAFELLADSGSLVAYPEYGPNMMWNLKYGMMSGRGGMMGGRGSYGGMMGGSYSGSAGAEVSPDMPITAEEAISYAQAYLDQYLPGAQASSHPTRFYGYYTLDYEIDGKEAGMLSINGFSGQAFPHTWHGTFIEEADMEME